MNDKIELKKTTVEKLKSDKNKQLIYWDSKLIGFGLRVSQGGSKTYFFQGRLRGREKKITIGRHGRITDVVARKEAKRIQSMMELGQDPTPLKESKGTASTFGDLMTAYTDLLKSQGKIAARNVENQITKDIERAFPKLWKKPVAAITIDDCMDIVSKLKDEEKPRQADKIRSYIRTAFSVAINARGNVNMPTSMRAFGLTTNPAREMQKVKGSSNAKDRALSLAEFRAYYRHLQELPEPKKSLAILHVLTGGQRQKQLSRVKLSDIDRDTGSLTIWDPKGRRETARRHVVPLIPEALKIVNTLIKGLKAVDATADDDEGDYIFSCNGGVSPIHDSYLDSAAKETCALMEAADELESAPFTAGIIRATAETRLIAKPYSVSSDVLAHLLSHGLGGIQQRHYQHHDFFEEKYDALIKLHNMLTQPKGKVTEIRRKRA